MFVAGMNPYYVMAFSTLTLVIAVPSSVKTINWLATLLGGTHSLHHSHAFYHRVCVSIHHRRLSGPMRATRSGQVFARHVFRRRPFPHDHGDAGVFALFAATYFWFPKMFADR